MSFIFTVIGLLVCLDLLWWVQGHLLLRKSRRAVGWHCALAIFMSLQLGILLWILIGQLRTDRSDEFLPTVLLASAFIWHMIILPVTAALWMITLLWFGANWLIRSLRMKPASVSEQALSRRDFLRVAAAFAPPVVSAVATGIALPQLSGFRMRSITVELANLPDALDGMTIAHVSDIHVGRFTYGRVLDDIVATTNDLDADLVLLTGDLINHALSDLDEGLQLVHRLKARCGIAMCEGNHDLIESRWEFERRTKASGAPILINDNSIVRVRDQRVQLLGLRWGGTLVSAGRGYQRGDEAIKASLSDLLRQRRDDAFPILLAHHPHAFDFAEEIPLTLSGHTHGGQLMLSDNIGFGPMMFRFWSGLYERDKRALVVSNGVGNWFPLRTNAPAEIVHITLRKEVV